MILELLVMISVMHVEREDTLLEIADMTEEREAQGEDVREAGVVAEAEVLEKGAEVEVQKKAPEGPANRNREVQIGREKIQRVVPQVPKRMVKRKMEEVVLGVEADPRKENAKDLQAQQEERHHRIRNEPHLLIRVQNHKKIEMAIRENLFFNQIDYSFCYSTFNKESQKKRIECDYFFRASRAASRVSLAIFQSSVEAMAAPSGAFSVNSN